MKPMKTYQANGEEHQRSLINEKSSHDALKKIVKQLYQEEFHGFSNSGRLKLKMKR